jgi:hypothetical protein
MRTARGLLVLLVFAAGLLGARPAHATFHLMQIEQVIAGVDGSTSVQAIQLRMRSLGQNQVQNARLVAVDAAGLNPVILKDMSTSVPNSTSGTRVLLATAGFATATNPPLAPDFTLTNPIPDTYLAAGSLLFEDDLGTIYWRLSWGGAGYTGPTTGVTSNDADGEFGPPIADGLPTASGVAELFQPGATAPSTNNAANYALTQGSAVFTNNAGASGTIVSAVSVPDEAHVGIALGNPIPNPAHGSISYTVTLPRPLRAQVGLYDLRGRRVLSLVDADLPAGRNSFTWDALDARGTALGPGVYFLGMSAGGMRRSARFVLLGKGAPLPHDE